MKKLSKIIPFVFCLLLFFLYVFPFCMILINSFKKRLDIIKNPLGFPEIFSLDNYKNASEIMSFGKAIVNSLLITTVSVFFIVIFSAMLAYYLARWKSKTNNFIYLCLVASMIIPFQCLMIPFVTIYGKLNLLNNRPMLIFFYIGFGVALATFMYHGFIKSIPFELEEAAVIDGASRFEVFFKVILPLLRPTTATIAILDVLWVWNDFLLPSLVLIDDSMRTIPLSNYYFFGSYTSAYDKAMAGLVMSVVPVLIFYLFMQKKIIKGVTDGAVK